MYDDRSIADRSWVWWAIAIVAVLALLFFLVLPAVTDDRMGGVATEEAAEDVTGAIGGADPTPSISDILENPVALEGNTVTVTGEVERRAGTRAFVLDEFGIAQDQILVITLDDQTLHDEGTQVSVTGVVRQGTIPEVENEFAIDIPREYEQEIEGRPFIVASSIAAQ